MSGAFLLAFVAGLVTILNPCVLPLVPVLVASALGKHRLGAVALAAGLGVSFTLFGFTIIAFGFQLGIDEGLVRTLAGALLAVAGLLLLVPAAQSALAALAAPLTNRAGQRLAAINNNGLTGQFMVGLLLGLVWAPCVGPTLGAAIAAASQGEGLLEAFFTFAIFALGVMLSILALAFASRRALGWNAKRLQMIARVAKPLLGLVLLAVGLLVVTGFDKLLETAILDLMPDAVVAFTTRF